MRSATIIVVASLLLAIAPVNHPAAAATEGSDPLRQVGATEIGRGYLLVDPHKVADRGLISALVDAGMFNAYIDRSQLDPRAAVLRVDEPSAGFAQTRGALIRAAARHGSLVEQARRAESFIKPVLATTPRAPGQSAVVRRGGVDQHVRHLVLKQSNATQAVARSAADMVALIDRLHAYRRGETLAGPELKAVAFDAYLRGQQATADKDGCDVRWTMFAAIGKTESRHGTLNNATLNVWGDPSRPLLGPLLDGGESKRTTINADGQQTPAGNGFAVVRDSDGGRLDGNARWDRAIGPMQFLPSTWYHWAADGNDDRREDPQNIYDAVAGAANLLCGLIDERGYDPHKYLLGYNGSASYARKVVSDAGKFEELFLPEVHSYTDTAS